MKQYAIIGLSNFGKFMLEELIKIDCEILVIDKKRELIEAIKDKVNSAFIADAINEETIQRLVPKTIDAAIIDLGDNIEVSILVTNYLKKMGVNRIVAKAESSQHGEILDIIGANTVVFPNREAAKRLVPMIFSDAVFGYFPIGDDLVIAEVIIPKKLAGKSVIDIDLRRESGLNIIALKKEDGYQQFVSGDHIIQEDEILLVSGSPDDISRFSGDKLPEIENRKKRNGLKSFF
ncbi:MAG: TrkA family potassium uptake protein [Spirochaetales bacterium]|nr:TrkA family potassium uptake protein [Spirochaetales bacterium]